MRFLVVGLLLALNGLHLRGGAMTKTSVVVLGAIVMAGLMVACTPEDEAETSQRYDSAKEVAADLEADNPSWSCVDAESLPGFLMGPDVGSAQQCTRDQATATIYVMEEGELPTFERTEEPPHTWWVAEPNWYAATASEELARDIQDSVGGTVNSSKQ